MKSKLLNREELEWSHVVANNSMNRERIAFGVNSYEKEININPIDFITGRNQQDSIRWTDLCCGTGNALIQASDHFQGEEVAPKLSIIGIDLVDYFSPHEANDILELRQMNLSYWEPGQKNDLITIVHGLHYIGDKIGLMVNSGRALKSDGIFIGNLDIDNIIIEGASNSKELILTFFKENDIEYNSRKKVIKIQGCSSINSGFIYLGADDKAGPNYTGQAVVNSFYKLSSR